MQAHFFRQPRRVPQLGDVPLFAGTGDRDQGARLFHRHQSERSRGAHIGDRHCFHPGQIAGQGKLLKDAASLVMEEMEHARAIDHGRIGIAVAIQVDPGQAAQA